MRALLALHRGNVDWRRGLCAFPSIGESGVEPLSRGNSRQVQRSRRQQLLRDTQYPYERQARISREWGLLRPAGNRESAFGTSIMSFSDWRLGVTRHYRATPPPSVCG